MSPAVPFQPGTPTMTARADLCEGPHVRYISWRPSEVFQLGGPSLQRAGPNRRTTGGVCGAQESNPKARSGATAWTSKHQLRKHRDIGALRRTSRFTILTPLGYFPLNGALSNDGPSQALTRDSQIILSPKRTPRVS